VSPPLQGAIPGSGLQDQVSKPIIHNVTSAMIPATARDKVSNVLWCRSLSHHYFLAQGMNFLSISEGYRHRFVIIRQFGKVTFQSNF
jgi:hypothetical protein